MLFVELAETPREQDHLDNAEDRGDDRQPLGQSAVDESCDREGYDPEEEGDPVIDKETTPRAPWRDHGQNQQHKTQGRDRQERPNHQSTGRNDESYLYCQPESTAPKLLEYTATPIAAGSHPLQPASSRCRPELNVRTTTDRRPRLKLN